MPSRRRPGLASIHIYVLPEVKAKFWAAVWEKGEETMTDALTRLMQNETKRLGAINARRERNKAQTTQ